MPTKNLSEMTAFEVGALDRARTALLLPISPIEEHGPHLPLATDLIEARGLGQRMVARLETDFPEWTFLEYPWVPLGSGCFPFPGTFDVRPSVIREIVEDIAGSFAEHGFRHVILLSHHGAPSHNLALDAAARNAKRRGARVLSLAGRLVAELYFEKGLKAFYEQQGIAREQRHMLNVDLHAGAFETSEVLVLRPDLVRDAYRDLEPVLVPLKEIRAGLTRTDWRHKGWFGAPAMASREFGEAFLDFVVERLYPDVARFLRGEDVPGMPMKWRVLLRTMGWVGEVKDALALASASTKRATSPDG